jgi:glycosyltransferase involved in cell wall biosynthesis
MEAAGGIESHVLEFCRRFAGAGWRVTLLCSRWAAGEATQRALHHAGVELRLNGSPRTSGSAAAKWLWTLGALARLSSRRFDAVYVNGQGRNAATLVRHFRGRARTVLHHHTACDAGDVATWPAAYRAALRDADVLVVCADFVRARMRRTLGRPDVEVAYCFSRRLAVPDAPVGPGARLAFGYFGRLIPEKGIDLMLRLARDPRLTGIEWLIWGPEGAYRAADFVGLRNVAYRGAFADAAGLERALAELHCYCLFSTHPEGLPIALLEVMGAGRAWIATGQGGIPELVHDPASCVLVALDDYDAVVETCALMADRLRAGRVDARRQRAVYEARFGAEALAEAWRRLLLDSGPGANRSSRAG